MLLFRVFGVYRVWELGFGAWDSEVLRLWEATWRVCGGHGLLLLCLYPSMAPGPQRYVK